MNPLAVDDMRRRLVHVYSLAFATPHQLRLVLADQARIHGGPPPRVVEGGKEAIMDWMEQNVFRGGVPYKAKRGDWEPPKPEP